MKILVTGASGFIGSAFVHRALTTTDHSIVALARNSEQRNLQRLYGSERGPTIKQAEASGRLRIVHGDLLGDISGICEGIDSVVHMAARTFVDHSVKDPWPFAEANVLGTLRILEDGRRNGVKRHIQFSTDETYGAAAEGSYSEDARINPTNPYSASKVGGDAFAVCYAHTFGMHTTITRCENVFGPYQHPQKVFPTFVRAALSGEKLPVYGSGEHIRQWIWIDDTIDAVLLLLRTDYAAGQIFHIAGNQELKNIELAEKILCALAKTSQNGFVLADDWHEHIRFVDASLLRPGHDFRYSLKCEKLKSLGWEVKVPLDEGITRAVAWYAANRWWWS